ncbi:MAG: DUF2089 domain-containing protein [Anaerolineae bacterium]|nr:DUF2089 domain-containing protein [Anaerolineae bacterium]
MQKFPANCSFCNGELAVTEFTCQDCRSVTSGQFMTGTFSQLSQEQLAFIEIFIRYEGKLSRMEGELGLSYPTIRNRLHDVIRTLGFEPGSDGSPTLSDEDRRRILEELDAGDISYDDAMQKLQGDE